ncbi:MAG: hypothetical protein ACJAU6_003684 [Alphaproteobacteria bacterium]|jgi:hypothetical protein
MAERIVLRVDPARIIKNAGGQRAHAGRRFQREAQITNACAAKLKVQPPPGFIGNVTVLADISPSDRNLITVEYNFNAKGRPGSALAPFTVADRNPKRFARRDEPSRATHAAA